MGRELLEQALIQLEHVRAHARDKVSCGLQDAIAYLRDFVMDVIGSVQSL